MSKPNNPFPGLRPFEANETHLFFGRERHVGEILRKLDLYRFVSIVGNSGSGKSSLVKAGVLPQLSKAKQAWKICTIRPGKDPVKELNHALLSQDILKANPSDTETNYNILKKSNLGLVQLIRGVVQSDQKILILVDQFEEIFRFNSLLDDEAAYELASHFVSLLLAAANQKDIPIYIMMTLRSDFLGDCEQFTGLPEAINDGQFLIPRMNRDDLSLSLTGPVRTVEGKITPRLVQQLLNEIGNNPDQLPLMQHVMMRSWEVWEDEGKEDDPIDVPHYLKTGGMQAALSNHAEEAFAELSAGQKKIAESIFKTITMKGPDNRGVRRPTSIETIAKIAETTIAKIIEIVDVFRTQDRGFITPQIHVSLGPASVLDISHESLMRAWDRLHKWVQEEADAAELYKRITESAMLYELGKAGLWRDPDLQIAVDWQQKYKPNQAWAQQYNSQFGSSTRFIEASSNEKRFVLAEKARRKKVTMSALIAFLIALSALSIWAVTERNNSATNAKAAIAEKIKADAQKKLAEDQTIIAESNYVKAKEEEARATNNQLETERQRRIALQRAEEAKLAKQIAESESGKANVARKAAEKERLIAERQRSISDSLRNKSVISEKNANRLRLLALAQNVAIKAKLADTNTMDLEVKALLALQSYRFNTQYNGKPMDVEIFGALFSAMRMYQKKENYVHQYHKDAVKSVCYNSSNGDLASTGDDGRVIISPKNHISKVVLTNPLALIYDNISYNDKGNQLAVSCDNNSLFLFNTLDITKPPEEIIGLHTDKILGIEWFGDKIITACLDNAVRIIDLKTKKTEKTFQAASRPLSIDLNLFSGRLVMGCDNGLVYTLNIKNDVAFRVLKDPKSGPIKCLNLSSDGSLLGVGTSSGQCLIMNTSQGDIKINLAGHQSGSGVTHIRFNSKNNLIATSCFDRKVRLFNLDDPGSQPIVFSEHEHWVEDVVFSPDESELASCGRDKTVRTYPINPAQMATFLEQKILRNLTDKEWTTYIGADITYEKTITNR